MKGGRGNPWLASVPTKTRIIYDLTLTHGGGESSVNAGTDFESAPPCDIGSVMQSVVWHILYL